MKQVKKYARRFEIVCWVLIPLVLISPVLVWFFGDNLLNSTYGPDIANFGLGKRGIMALLGLSETLFVAYGLTVCITIARLFQAGEVFTPKTAALFARLKTISLFWALYGLSLGIVVSRIIMPAMPLSVAATMFGTSALFSFFIFSFLSILAFIVSKAVTLQKDQDLTV